MATLDDSREEDGSFHFSGRLADETLLCISLLTDRAATACGLEPEQAGGYFLYQQDSADIRDITLLARVVSADAAFSLSRLLNLK